MAIPLERKDRLLDVVCPQGHIVSIVVSGESLPVLYSTVRGTTLVPSYAVAPDGLAPLTGLESIDAWDYHIAEDRMPSVVVLCRRCRAVYDLDHADCLTALALPTVEGRTQRLTLRVAAAKSR